MTLPSAVIFLTIFIAVLHVLTVSTNGYDCMNRIDIELGHKLSLRASIDHDSAVLPRFSSYYSPRPGTIVNVAEENDVVETVKYCIKNNIKFLVQSGGHGLATTFDIGDKDLIINMRGLNQVFVNDAKDKLTFEGGALVDEAWSVAYENKIQSTIPTCRCVGMSGAILGGGLNLLMGTYGLAIDNLLSINLVTAEGQLIIVTPDSEPDLWWALRGAGANFGIVTSVTMKAYPPINNGTGWIGTLSFTPDKLEDLVQALSNFDYPNEMYLFFRFSPSTPDLVPGIMVDIVYSGPQEAAKASLKALYNLEPMNEISKEVPYNEFSSIVDSGCTKGFRNPTYAVGLKKLDPKTFRKIWNEYVSFVSQNPALAVTIVYIEAYSPTGIGKFPNSSSAFPHRDVKFQTFISVQYTNAALDPLAEGFGTKIRQMLKESGGFNDLKAYVNYAHGDEDLMEIYGGSLSLLKQMKKKWDKDDRFSQFFPIH